MLQPINRRRSMPSIYEDTAPLAFDPEELGWLSDCEDGESVESRSDFSTATASGLRGLTVTDHVAAAGDAQAVLHALVKLLVRLFAAQRIIILVLASLVFACMAR